MENPQVPPIPWAAPRRAANAQHETKYPPQMLATVRKTWFQVEVRVKIEISMNRVEMCVYTDPLRGTSYTVIHAATSVVTTKKNNNQLESVREDRHARPQAAEKKNEKTQSRVQIPYELSATTLSRGCGRGMPSALPAECTVPQKYD